MRKTLGTVVLWFLTAHLFAQTNAPVKLALLAETDEASPVADVLTATLSGNGKVQLLERDEIEKVYREQGMSAANRDDLKLGRIVGADGLLLLNVVRTPQETNLTARLIAVKPGVVLTDVGFPWPLMETTQWAVSAATYLNSFLPKLTVLAKDVIPISIVNLRATVSSTDEQETERDLKLLTIQRLSQERQFFVLERQKMQLLSEEKELKFDESAFWDGSYLLDGIVDQNGYSENTVTINARLIPPKGGAPLSFEVSGNRTNLAEVVNRLAVKVTELLKVRSTVPEWSATNEAAQYFDEAKWALRWGMFSEGQAAADSAWALGKNDMDCAVIRIQAYETPLRAYQAAEFADHPDPKMIETAAHALELYYAFSRNTPDDLLKAGSQETGWANSEWYNLGIEDLEAASMVLEVFSFAPEAEKNAADKLADLRALARTVAGFISKLPSVHDSYFVGDRIATYDELAFTIEEQPNIFKCEATWGRFWQETPEDCVALYRTLMSSPVFCYVQKDVWSLDPPRLVAWNAEDKKRIPAIWDRFLQEMNDSSNVLLHLEAKAFQLMDSPDDKQRAASFTNFFNALFENRDALVANNVDVLYLQWHASDLVDRNDALWRFYYSEYRPKLEAMEEEYRNKTVPAIKFAPRFQIQVQYLKDYRPYEFYEFMSLFNLSDYSKSQALEIRPLISAYTSNLVARASEREKFKAKGDSNWIELVLGKPVNEILNPTVIKSSSSKIIQGTKLPAESQMTMSQRLQMLPEIVTNVITVNNFFTLPWQQLVDLTNSQRFENAQAKMTAHHWFEGNLVLDFDYSAGLQWLDEKGKVIDVRNVGGPAIAIFNPGTEHWDLVGCPEMDSMAQNNYYHRTAYLNGDLFNCDGGQIRKYDFTCRQWETLKISDGNNCELFVANGHLYGANQEAIFEIIDGGNATRLLASTRRHPPLSTLDTNELGTPIIIGGPNHSLRVVIKNQIFSWAGNDWHEDVTMPSSPSLFETIPNGLLLRCIDSLDGIFSLSCLTTGIRSPEPYLSRKFQPPATRFPFGFHAGINKTLEQEPLWKMPPGLSFTHLPAAGSQSGLYLLMNHSDLQEITNNRNELVQEKVLSKDSYNAVLLCFSHGLPEPQKLFLDFDAPEGCPPGAGIYPGQEGWSPSPPPAWMFCATNFLFFGLENSRNSFPAFNRADWIGIGYKAGVWLVPLSQLEPAIAAQKKVQLAQQAQAAAAKKQAQEALLAKYDRNHNGIIDLSEREEALDDPAFIESQLDVIDTNHNDLLEPEELIYFDANQNKVLDPNELAGINIAEHLFAERLIYKFDWNDVGALDHAEFDELWQYGNFRGNVPLERSGAAYPYADLNHDNQIDLVELEAFLKQQLLKRLQPRRSFGIPPHFGPMKITNSPNDQQQLFKNAVETYWRNSGSVTNQLPINRMIQPAGGRVSNGTPGASTR